MQFYLLLLAAFGAMPALAAYDRAAAASQVNALCAAGEAEGTYRLSLGKSGALQLHLLCTPEGEMLVTGFVGPDGEAFSLPHWALDGDTLTFVGFNPAPEEARNMGGFGGPEVRIRLSLSALHRAELKGTYQGGMTPFPIGVRGQREKTFPACGSPNAASAFAGEGYYEVESAPAGANLAKGSVIGVEVIGGVQRIYVVSPGNFGMGLYNGLDAASAGSSFCANLGIDDDQHGRGPMAGVRGTITGAREATFFYFSSRHGMQGPFIAKKR